VEQHIVGVDFGQSRDYTAIAVVSREEVAGEWDAAAFARRKRERLLLRYLERVPLGTPYPEVVARVVAVTRSAELAGRCRLIVDGTGVGRPLVDLLRQSRPGCGVTAVTVTGGEQETQGGGYCGIPKRDLIVGLQVMLQQGRLEIASGMAWGPALVKEMAAMQVKVTPAGREQYGAWREGEHDDLVFAVALACWGVKKMYPETGGWMQAKGQSEMAKLLAGMKG
jgi:hypothetical protein